MHLRAHELAAVESRVADLEARIGVQVVTAIVGRSDAYPELAWKAFAMGAVTGSLVVVAMDVLRPDWMHANAAWANVIPVLGIAAASGLLALVSRPYSRLFLNRVRAECEVRQCAQAMFLDRGLFRTRSRNGVLLFASAFERRVEVLADIGFDGRVAADEWRTVVDAMTPHLADTRPADALLRGLDRLETLLAGKGYRAAATVASLRDDALPNRPIDQP